MVHHLLLIFLLCYNITMNQELPKKSIEEEYGITDKNGQSFEIPVKGSITILALGYRGIMAWRAKRIEAGLNETPREQADETGEK